MFVKRVTVNATTSSGGAATVYSGRITGKILGIVYQKTDFAAGVDFTITTEAGGENVWVDTNVDASETVYPRRLVQDTAGADIADTYEPVYIGNDRVKFVIANGGDTKTGTFYVLVG